MKKAEKRTAGRPKGSGDNPCQFQTRISQKLRDAIDAHIKTHGKGIASEVARKALAKAFGVK